MLKQDYFRLGRLSLKSRKKSTRNTVLGVSLGLILLIPVIFFSLSFYAALSGAINEKRSFLTLTVPVGAEEESSSSVAGGFTFGREDARLFAQQDIEQIDYSEYYYSNGGDFRSTNRYSLSIGDKEMQRRNIEVAFTAAEEAFGYGSSNGQSAGKIKVIDLGRGSGIIPESYADDLEKEGAEVLLAGRAPGKDARGEIAISERYARLFFGENPGRAVGQKLTLTGKGKFETFGGKGVPQTGYYRDNDADPSNAPVYAGTDSEPEFSVDVLKDFTVVGVISESYYALNSITAYDAHLWISRASVYEDGDELPKYLPALTRRQVADANGQPRYCQVVTYPEEISVLEQKAAEEGMFFPAVPVFTFSSLRSFDTAVFPLTFVKPVEMQTIQCTSFRAANSLANTMNDCYSEATGVEGYSYIGVFAASSGFSRFQLIYNIGNFITAALYIVGGVILFSTLLNLYNSIHYSVQVRKNYLGMMRAIGARPGLLPKLYFVEMILIFLMSLLWAIPLSALLSWAIKYIVASYFARTVSDGLTVADLLGVSLDLNYLYYFAALGIVCALILLVATVYTLAACRKLSRDGITEILADEK